MARNAGPVGFVGPPKSDNLPYPTWDLGPQKEPETRTEQGETPVTEPTATAPLTRDDVPAVLDAALSRFEELRTPHFDPSTAFSIDAGTAGRDHPGKLEILFSAKPAHREELLGRLRKGLQAAGYDARPQDIPQLVGSGTLSILVSRSPDAERMIAAALSETIDRLTRDVALPTHSFVSRHRQDLAQCTEAAREGLLVRFVVAYLVSNGLVAAAPARHRVWLPLDLEEPHASALDAALAEAVEQRARFDASARAMDREG